jgi:hypothetical protein
MTLKLIVKQIEKEKKINALAKLFSVSKTGFDIFSWECKIQWVDLKVAF